MVETVSNAIIIWRGTFEGGTTFNSVDNKVYPITIFLRIFVFVSVGESNISNL